MQAAGYSTYYSGKLFNGYSAENYCEPHCLEGLSSAHVLLDPSMYKYYNSSWTSYDGHKWTVDANFTGYNTDQITEDVSVFLVWSAVDGAINTIDHRRLPTTSTQMLIPENRSSLSRLPSRRTCQPFPSTNIKISTLDYRCRGLPIGIQQTEAALQPCGPWTN